MNEKENIEQLFRKEFESFEVQPSEKVWKRVRYDLFIKNFFRYSPRSFNIYYLAGVVAVSSIAIFNLSSSKRISNESTGNHSTTISNTTDSLVSTLKQAVQNETASISETPAGSTGNLPISENQDQPTSNPSLSNLFKDKTRNTESGTVSQEQIVAPVSDKPLSPSKENNTNYSGQAVLAWFECITPRGCAPLSAGFHNLSQNAVRYSWSFGDGGSSDQANPSYIFDEPGTWFVSLTAYSANNEISVFTDSVKVSPLPEARFSMDMQGLPGSGQPVYFYNYSRGAANYSWDFGDGSTSTLKEPDHYFNKEAQTNIKLLAFSTAGCKDSLILKDAFKDGEPVFIFPSAFSPNTNGPGTGQYTRKDPANDVFHPYVELEPEEYQLRIFNRQGLLIFESKDILIGWNGYYREELQPQGVYVWKARAVFPDGRSVVKMGDVTMLWGSGNGVTR